MTGIPHGRRREVTFVTRILTHYRVPFHQRLRVQLAAQGIAYRLLCGQPNPSEAAKGDLASLDWAEHIRNLAPVGGERLVWQAIHSKIRNSDLVILGQENGLLVNYPLQLLRRPDRKLALFGHGRNFQSRAPDGLAERWKRFWATRCDWWFAYTDETRHHIESLGFPPGRITVFNNAIDTAELRSAAEGLSEAEVAGAYAALGMKGSHVAIFVGGLYPDKRLDFLVEAAGLVRQRMPDFELLVIGGGVDFARLQSLSASRPWLFAAGPRFRREKAALMRGAKLFVMPGLVGLAVLDAGALGLPVVTSAWPWHSPEIAYLQDGVNGVVVRQWDDASAYAAAVAELLLDDARRTNLANAARKMAQAYTIEAMAERFAGGVLAALAN